MKDLMAAIYAKFTAAPANSLYTALSGKLAPHEAKQEWSMPYGVYTLVSNTPTYTLGGSVAWEETVVQIDLYSDKNSPADVLNYYEYCTALFDFAELTVANHTHLMMERQFNQLIREADPGYWHYVVEYRLVEEPT
jgi:hypothetical protein